MLLRRLYALRRLYFVLPDVETAHQVESELLLARIEDRHMHFLAKRGVDLGDLPEATVAQKTDLVHGMEVGLVAGGGTGVIVGLLDCLVGIGTDLGVGSIFLFGMLGAGFGLWASSMIAASVPNCRLKSFEKAIEEGHILLMVDVPKRRIKEISAIIRKHHPDAEAHGIEPTLVFP
jgi:hypothetical protein